MPTADFFVSPKKQKEKKMCQDLVAFFHAFPGAVDADLLNTNPDEDDQVGPTTDPLHDFVPVEEIAAVEMTDDESDEEAAEDNPHGLSDEQTEVYERVYEEYRANGCGDDVADMIALGAATDRLQLYDYCDYGEDKGLTLEEDERISVPFGSFGREHVRPRGISVGEFRDHGPRRSKRPSVGLPYQSHVDKRQKPSRDTVRGARVRADVLVYDDELGGGYIFCGLVAEVRHAR